MKTPRSSFNLILILFVILLSSVYIYIQSKQTKENESLDIWNMEPEVRNKSRSNLWFLNRPGPKNTGDPKKLADSITGMLRDDTDDVIDEVYVNQAIDTKHGAIYISVSDDSEETLDRFMDAIGNPTTVDVHFIKAPATLSELKEWVSEIDDHFEELRSQGVKVVLLGISVNGTILMGVEDIRREKICIILDVLDGKVPPGILEISKQAPIELD